MKRAFTLIELMVVMAIIAILAAMLLPQVGNMVEKARIANAQGEVRNVATSMYALLSDTGRSPGERTGGVMGDTTGQGLNSCNYGLVCNSGYPATWDGPYLMKAIQLDPWGRQYWYDGAPSEWTSATPGQASFGSGGPDGTQSCWNQSDLDCAGFDDLVVYLHK